MRNHKIEQSKPVYFVAKPQFRKMSNEVHTRGHVYLGTDGCGMQHVLITCGAEGGNVWMISGEGAQPIYFDEEKRYTFLDWLEAWLQGKELFSR